MNYYQENMGYQENWLPHYQKKLGNYVEVLTSDKYFNFPDYKISMKPILGDRHVGTGTYYDNDIKIIRKKSYFEYSKRNIILFDTLDYLNKFMPDIVHLHGSTNLNIFNIIKYVKNNNTKLFIDSHSDYNNTGVNSLANKIYYKYWSLYYKKIDKFINYFLPITNNSLRYLNQEFKIPINKMIINHLGVNINKFYFDQKENIKLRDKYNIEDKIVIINAGKQNEDKKIDFIINTIKLLIIKYKITNIVLILIGNSNSEYAKKIDLASIGIEKNIIRIPFLKNDKLKDYYSVADIGIWPSASNTIQEAMACNVGMLLPRNEVLSHLIKDNGFFMESFDENEVALSLKDMITSESYKNFKINSRKLIELYSWRNIAKESLTIYGK
jgi:hypothetical protein